MGSRAAARGVRTAAHNLLWVDAGQIKKTATHPFSASRRCWSSSSPSITATASSTGSARAWSGRCCVESLGSRDHRLLAQTRSQYRRDPARRHPCGAAGRRNRSRDGARISPLLVFRLWRCRARFLLALPAYGNEIILVIKALSLASNLTLPTSTGVARHSVARTTRPTRCFPSSPARSISPPIVTTPFSPAPNVGSIPERRAAKAPSAGR